MSDGEPSRGVLGLLGLAVVVLLVFALLFVLPFILFVLPLPSGTELDLDPAASGVVSIALPPTDGEIGVRFDAARAKVSTATEDPHSVSIENGQTTVTFPDCPFPRGCRIVLNLIDVEEDLADQRILLAYPERDSEYLDDIVLEYSK